MDSRIQPLAYLTDETDLFEVMEIRPMLNGKHTVTCENCRTGLRRLFSEKEAGELQVVREAPGACPNYVAAA